jgi:sterol 3beta-glucosyltransferase
MRIDIVAIGSEGDVRPAVALGAGLQRAGHHVRIVALEGLDALVRSCGLDYLAIGSSAKQIAGTAEGRKWVTGRSSTAGFLRGFVTLAVSLIEVGIATYWQNRREVDVIIATSMGVPVAMHIAERLDVPLIAISFVPTRHDWAGLENRASAIGRDLSAALFRQVIWSRLRGVTNAARRDVLALPPLPLTERLVARRLKRFLMLEAYSPSVVPRPIAVDGIHVTGYFFLDEHPGWAAPAELIDFLRAGPPPVFVGFGSTPFPNADAATGIVVSALTRAGQRGLVVAGGSGLATGRLTQDILSVDAVPHGWLFPQVSAAVHHGGAGVTGAALRAGLPSVVVPIFGDQPFWGERVFALGAGPSPIPAARITADALAKAIRLTSGREMRRRAANLGEQIRAENGVSRAVEVVEHHVGATPHARRAS